MTYETKFADGSEITSYLATGYAEGFEEASDIDKLKAWSYLIGTGLAYQLQGFFGRQAAHMIDSGFIDSNGIVDWDSVNELLDNY